MSDTKETTGPTPGPWQAFRREEDCQRIDAANSTESREDGWDVSGPALLLVDYAEGTVLYTKADAQLVAAAPELYAAALAQEALDDHIANCDDCLDEVAPELCEEGFPLADHARLLRREAIAKVRGEHP